MQINHTKLDFWFGPSFAAAQQPQPLALLISYNTTNNPPSLPHFRLDPLPRVLERVHDLGLGAPGGRLLLVFVGVVVVVVEGVGLDGLIRLELCCWLRVVVLVVRWMDWIVGYSNLKPTTKHTQPITTQANHHP
jgi:hypothetical protein